MFSFRLSLEPITFVQATKNGETHMDIRKSPKEGHRFYGSNGFFLSDSRRKKDLDYIKYYEGGDGPLFPNTWKDSCVMKFEGIEQATVAFTLGPFSNGYVVDVAIGDWVIHQSRLQGLIFSCLLSSTFFLRDRADAACVECGVACGVALRICL
jgi:hypothetical protein